MGRQSFGPWRRQESSMTSKKRKEICGETQEDAERLCRHRPRPGVLSFGASRGTSTSQKTSLQEALLRALQGRGCPVDAGGLAALAEAHGVPPVGGYHTPVLRAGGVAELDGGTLRSASAARSGERARGQPRGLDGRLALAPARAAPRFARGATQLPRSHPTALRRWPELPRHRDGLTGISVGNVKTRLYRGRKAIQRLLRDRARTCSRHSPRAGKPTGGSRP